MRVTLFEGSRSYALNTLRKKIFVTLTPFANARRLNHIFTMQNIYLRDLVCLNLPPTGKTLSRNPDSLFLKLVRLFLPRPSFFLFFFPFRLVLQAPLAGVCIFPILDSIHTLFHFSCVKTWGSPPQVKFMQSESGSPPPLLSWNAKNKQPRTNSRPFRLSHFSLPCDLPGASVVLRHHRRPRPAAKLTRHTSPILRGHDSPPLGSQKSPRHNLGQDRKKEVTGIPPASRSVPVAYLLSAFVCLFVCVLFYSAVLRFYFFFQGFLLSSQLPPLHISFFFSFWDKLTYFHFWYFFIVIFLPHSLLIFILFFLYFGNKWYILTRPIYFYRIGLIAFSSNLLFFIFPNLFISGT